MEKNSVKALKASYIKGLRNKKRQNDIEVLIFAGIYDADYDTVVADLELISTYTAELEQGTVSP